MDDLNVQVSLDYVVASVINAAQMDERKYVHIKQLVIDGYQDMCMFHLNNTKVSYLPIEDGNVVTIPPDFVVYSNIGVVEGGKIYTLTRDDNLALPREMDCGEDVDIDYTLPTSDTAMVLGGRRGFDLGYFANRGGVNIGYYRIDKKRGVIQLSGVTGYTNIVLEYNSIPINVGEDTMVPRYIVPALRAYVMEKVVQYDVRVRDNEKERRHQDYMAELYKVRMLENSLTADELRDIINSTRQQSPKR
jgi:hypothetical protein